MNITLNDLKTEWLARDRELHARVRINALILREALLEKHSTNVGRASANLFTILFSIPFLIFFGWFIARHISEPAFLLPAVLLQVWTIVTLALTIHQRGQLRDLDYSRPVLALQTEIEQIKIARLSTFKWSFLTGQILWWVPFVLVLVKGVLGVNLYTVSDFMPTFIAWNIGIGIAFIPLALWVSKLLVGKVGASPKFQQFTDGIAGQDVVVAREFLTKLAKFELEPSGK